MTMTKRVTIVGMGRSVHDFCEMARSPLSPIHEGEVWAINLMAANIRCDRAVVMDDLDYLKGVFPPAVLDRWKTVPRLVTSREHPDFPNSEAYPISRIAGFGVPYLNNTVAYAVALAVAEDFTEIRLYGCDFGYADQLLDSGTAAFAKMAKQFVDALAAAPDKADDLKRDFHAAVTNVVRQIAQTEDGRACTEFWLGIAASRGITIELSRSTTLMDSHKPTTLYGYAVQPTLAPEAA